MEDDWYYKRTNKQTSKDRMTGIIKGRMPPVQGRAKEPVTAL